MIDDWLMAFSQWAQTDQHMDRVAEANDTIVGSATDALAYCSYSGGKDSLVLTHLCLQHFPGMMVWHWDYGPFYTPRPLEQEILSAARQIGATNLRTDTSPRYERGPSRENVFNAEVFGRVLPAMADEGYTVGFIGLRKQESLKRRRRMVANRTYGPIPEVWPLADWTWMDVWAYIVHWGLPYLSYYDQVAPVVGYDQARFSSLFDPQMDSIGAQSVDGVLHWRWRHGSV